MKKIFVLITALGILLQANAQNNNTATSDFAEINTITTAVVFLKISPDARAAGMGDAGIALNSDVNGLYLNPSKLAFAERKYGVGLTYTPWLKQVADDIFIAGMNGYYKLDDMQSLGATLRYFSLGQITYRDEAGNEQNQDNPNEFAIDGHYSRKLSDNFAIGASLRFIYSNLASGAEVDGNTISAGTAGSMDISLTYRKPIKISDLDAELGIGANISNIGSKINYTSDETKDFIPTNLGLGAALELDLDDYNEINIVWDVNKLLVPSPDARVDQNGNFINDENNNGIPDFREKSVVAGMFGSFNDAPGGFSEELKEFNTAFGLEYWYQKQFAARAGYFYESQFKGARNYLTLGLGLKYSVFTFNLSYLAPTSKERGPLDNTLRFSFIFDFEGNDKAEQPKEL